MDHIVSCYAKPETQRDERGVPQRCTWQVCYVTTWHTELLSREYNCEMIGWLSLFWARMLMERGELPAISAAFLLKHTYSVH